MNEEIYGGLKNAVEKGYSLDAAMKSFISAGYSPKEVQEAAQELSPGVHENTTNSQNAASGLQNIPGQNKNTFESDKIQAQQIQQKPMSFVPGQQTAVQQTPGQQFSAPSAGTSVQKSPQAKPWVVVLLIVVIVLLAAAILGVIFLDKLTGFIKGIIG